MEITADQAYQWAQVYREGTIREIDELIKELERSRSLLAKGNSYHVGGNPETRLKQIMEQQHRAETMALLADHIEINERKTSTR